MKTKYLYTFKFNAGQVMFTGTEIEARQFIKKLDRTIISFEKEAINE